MLKIGTELVGKQWPTRTCTVGWRETTNFAAAMSDMNPRYIDDEHYDTLLVPPMFSLSLTVPLLHKIYDMLPADVFDTRVHYTDQLVFHKPLKPGDTVTVDAVIVSIAQQRANTALTFRISVRDEMGEPYLQEYHGIVLRGVTCEIPEGACMDRAPDRPQCPPVIGLPKWEIPVPVLREFPYLYDACTSISFGIHTSPKFAKGAGLPDILVSGAPIIGFGLREIVNREAGGDASKVVTVYGKMTKMVFPESYVKVQMLHSVEDEMGFDQFFQVVNGQNELVIKDGYVRLTK